MKWKNLLLAAAFFIPISCQADTSKDTVPTDAQTWIAFLPVILFVLIVTMTMLKLLKDKTKLSEFLAEKDVTIPAVAAPPAPQRSASRLIAFLTGLVALAIGVCICTFYMYCYFSNPERKIDLSNLTTVIWGLGIGVLPYGFNKASSALK